MAEEAVNPTAPKNARKRPQKLHHRKDSWMGSPILISPNFEEAGNGARLCGNSKVHPLSSFERERSTATKTPPANDSLQLSSIGEQNPSLAADQGAANVINEDKERRKRRRKIAIIVLVLLAALMSLVVAILYWKLRAPTNPVQTSNRPRHEHENNETKTAPTSHQVLQHSSVVRGAELEGDKTEGQQVTLYHTENTATAAFQSLHSIPASGRSVAKLSVESSKDKSVSWKGSKTSAEPVISRKTLESLSSSWNFRGSDSHSYLSSGRETGFATTTDVELEKTSTKTLGHIESVGDISITATVLMNPLSSYADISTGPSPTEAAKSLGDNDESRNLDSTAAVISSSMKMYPGNVSSVVATPTLRSSQPTDSAAETGSPFTRDVSHAKIVSSDDKQKSSESSYRPSEGRLVKSSSKTHLVQFSSSSSLMEMTESSKASTTRDAVTSAEQESTSGGPHASPGGISGLVSFGKTSGVVSSLEQPIKITPSAHSTSLVEITSAVVLPKCRKGAVDESLPHPGDCSKYIRCYSGNRRDVMSCAAGTLFDPKKKSCQLKDKVTCKSKGR